MFRIKAIAALALAGLGGATMGTDAYLAAHHPSAPNYELPQMAVSKPMSEAAPLRPSQTVTNDVVTLSPVTITSRPAARRRAAPQVVQEPRDQRFVPCSEWRSLDTGPAGRGVRTLCVQEPPSRAD
jgi:hypothetical protein